MNENKYVAVSLLDSPKAFDSINHNLLKNKLYDLGFSELAIEMFHSFISNRQQKTVLKKLNPIGFHFTKT